MKDFIETAEALAERRYDEMDQGDDMLKCICGEIFPVVEGNAATADPWGMPVCRDCQALGVIE